VRHLWLLLVFDIRIVTNKYNGDNVTLKHHKPGHHQQFTEAETIEFNRKREEDASTWSKIDRMTIDKQTNFVETWDE